MAGIPSTPAIAMGLEPNLAHEAVPVCAGVKRWDTRSGMKEAPPAAEDVLENQPTMSTTTSAVA